MADQKKSDKKKVLFILPTLGAGGAERVLITFMNGLDPKAWDRHFLTFNEQGAARAWIDPSVTFHSFGVSRVSRSFFRLISFVRQLKPDVIVTTMVHTNAMVLILKRIFPEIRVLVRESSMPHALIQEYGWKGRMCKYVYKYLYPYADIVISPSRLIPLQFKEGYGISIKKHRVLYNPVDLEAINRSLLDRFEISKNRKHVVRFCFLGRLAFEKGLDRLLDALHAHKLPFEWHLDILGDGEEFEPLRDRIHRYNLANNVTLHGYNPAPWTVLAQSDCLVLPSRWEGLPNVVLEALACGVPCIVHKDAGAVQEIAEAAEPGTVLVAQDMEDFVKKMSKIKPAPKQKRAPSELPAIFSRDHILQMFETYLNGSDHSKS